MKSESKITPGKFLFRKTFLWIITGIFIVITVVALFVYHNFNRLLSDALQKNFNSSITSDVYELKFKDLNVNLRLGNIRVKDVELIPREKPLKYYPYINSSFKLTTKEILLTNVEIFDLLTLNMLKLKSIVIDKPQVQIMISDEIPVFLPFNDTISIAADSLQNTSKRPISGFFLNQFQLKDASIHLTNFAKERDLQISEVNIDLKDLRIDQKPGKDLYSYSHFDFHIGEMKGELQKQSIKKISFNNYHITIDSLEIEKTVDTLIYHFDDFGLGLKDLDVQTADSIFHLSLHEFNLSYREKSVELKNITFKPNISESEIQKKVKFQLTHFSGSAALVHITGIDFDSLIYRRKLFVDEITIDSGTVFIFKNKTIPLNPKHFPEYLGQSIAAIKLPILIKQVTATNANLVSNEITPDSSFATANINRASLKVENITNIDTNKALLMNADAFLENKVRFYLSLGFDYKQPKFNFKGLFPKFSLKDLNPLINSFTPVLVSNGIVNEIEFSGSANKTSAAGTMKFLYNDLKVELKIENKAQWISSVLSFAANTVVGSSNPASENVPARIVNYEIERDMNKAFVNVIIKSALFGLRETLHMSKENKKLYKDARKKAKQERKNQ